MKIIQILIFWLSELEEAGTVLKSMLNISRFYSSSSSTQYHSIPVRGDDDRSLAPQSSPHGGPQAAPRDHVHAGAGLVQ